MKTILYLLTLFAVVQTAFGQDLEFDWSYNFGGTEDDNVRSAALDKEGNTVLTGFFSEQIVFDGTTYTSEDFAVNGYVVKLDKNGSPIWFKQFEAPSFDDCTPYAIAVDADNNYYVAGSISGEADVDPGLGELILASNGAHDIFIGKYDSDLNLIWAEVIGGNDWDRVLNMDIDDQGNIYMTGYFGATVDFDPGPGSNTITGDVEDDVFVLKLNSAGAFEWVWAVKTVGPRDGGYGIKTKGDHLYVTGAFKGVATFPNGNTTMDKDAGDNSASFVAKMTKNGDLVWLQTFEGGGENEARAVNVDSKGNVLVSGDFKDIVDFDPGSGVSELDGFLQPFLLQLSADGDYQWSYTNTAFKGEEVELDKNDNVYQFGTLLGEVDFDPGTGELNLGASGNQNGYLAKLSGTGDFITAIELESVNGGMYAYDMVKDQDDNLFLVGEYWEDINLGAANLSNGGSNDPFIVRINTRTVSSITDFEKAIDGELSYFPNPVLEELHMSFEKTQEEICVELYTTEGMKAYERMYKNINQIKMPLALIPGSYFVKLRNTKGGTNSFKILLN